MEFDFRRLTLNELRDLAKANQVKGIAKLRKPELIALLEELLQDSDQVKPAAELVDSEASEGPDPSEAADELDNRTGDEFAPHQHEADQELGASPSAEPAAGGGYPPQIGQAVQEATAAGVGSSAEAGSSRETSYVDRNGIALKEKLSRRFEPMRSERDGSAGYERSTARSAEDRSDSGERSFPPDTIEVTGILEIMDQNSFGFLRGDNYLTTPDDIYVSPTQIRRFRLKTGDEVAGKTRPTREGEKFKALFYVDRVNGDPPGSAITRRDFETLTPIYPNQRLRLEVPERNDMSTRIIDIISPVGKGQRGMIVAPPKAGKTTILKKIAQHIHINNPETVLIVLLIDERPEEVTDMRESIQGEVIYSTFDEDPMNHIKVAGMVLERAKRLVEHKKDVVILLDSLTRLSRAYNLTVTPSGRTLSGGLDPAALLMPKKFFGAARNIRNGGSLTILATALVDTGSRMDDMIFEEFKGTGNMEVHLDRRLQERRIFPAIDIYRSGTRKEELILTGDELEAVRKIRALLYRTSEISKVTQELISLLDNSETNEEFMDALKKVQLTERS